MCEHIQKKFQPNVSRCNPSNILLLAMFCCNNIFQNLFQFKLKDSEKLRECQQIIPDNCTYLSPDIQNELISIIAELVMEAIVSEINSADVDFFTILVDGTKDMKNRFYRSKVCAQWQTVGVFVRL